MGVLGLHTHMIRSRRLCQQVCTLTVTSHIISASSLQEEGTSGKKPTSPSAVLRSHFKHCETCQEFAILVRLGDDVAGASPQPELTFRVVEA